jgi:hypothetical protein
METKCKIDPGLLQWDQKMATTEDSVSEFLVAITLSSFATNLPLDYYQTINNYCYACSIALLEVLDFNIGMFIENAILNCP